MSVPAYRRSLPQRYALMGLKCSTCNAIVFPPKAYCPHCRSSGAVSPVRLKPEGEVYSFAEISAAGSPPEFAHLARTRDSYVVALIRLDEGPRIMAQVVTSGKQVQIGSRVHGVFKQVYTEEGIVRYGLKFQVV